MGIANYTNMSELMNRMLRENQAGVSISDMVREAAGRKLILASEGEMADRGDLENAFIALVDVQYRSGMIRPQPDTDAQHRILELYERGDLAKNGYGGKEGDLFLDIKWTALSDNLPVIVNISL